MSKSGNVSPTRPLIVGGLIGLIIGLIIGLTYAWVINPATYAGGAYPNEMSQTYQEYYVQAVSEAYLLTRDVSAASQRLDPFSVEEKVALLAGVAKDFAATGQTAEAALVGDLAVALSAQEGWPPEEVAAGLSAGDASKDFAMKLGHVVEGEGAVAQPPTEQSPPTQEQPSNEADSGGSSIGRIILIVLVVIVAIALVLFLLTRIKPKRKVTGPIIPDEMRAEAGADLQPLRQWIGTYTIGQDTYDESFTIETPESDFLGECGMGIMDDFAHGSPKRVLAFDVWLFDKTDIRTISVPVMSEFAFNDDRLRAKLDPNANPVLGTQGNTFEIETSALSVRAKIVEVGYGDDPPPNSYFTSLKVSLSVYLKPGVDTSAPMGIPDSHA